MSSDFRLEAVVMPFLGNLNDRTFLDVACGLGKWGYSIKLGWSGVPRYTVGIDIWRPNLRFVKHHRAYDDVILADARFLPLVTKSFDIACACEFLLHFKKSEGLAVLEEVERVSRRRIVVSVPNKNVRFGEDPDNPFEKTISQWSTRDLEDLGYKVKGVGFQIRGHRISSHILSGLTYISILKGFAEIIVGKKELVQDAQY